MSKPRKVTDNEMKCLCALADILNEHDPEHYLPFAPVCEETKLPRNIVRRSIRALARKGLTEYQKGLCNDDGEFAGAGYRPTKQGYEIAMKAEKTGVGS